MHPVPEVVGNVTQTDRRPQGASGVVVRFQRHAEFGHDGITNELVDAGSLFRQHGAGASEVVVEHFNDLLGAELFADRREIADVGEQHRHFARFTAEAWQLAGANQGIDDLRFDVAGEHIA